MKKQNQVSHYAIVKCERHQKSWRFKNTREKKYQFYVDTLLDYAVKFQTRSDSDWYKERIKEWSARWEEELKKYVDVYDLHIKNGECVLWEGKVNQERLRVTDNLYIPTVDKYLEILRVDVKPSGEIVYYVNYIKLFDDTEEQDRLKVVEEWFTNTYSQIESFEELKNEKDSISPQRQAYNSTMEAINKIMYPDLTWSDMIKEVEEKDPVRLPDDALDWHKPIYDSLSKQEQTSDQSWQRILLFCGIGAVAIIAFMFMMSIS